MVSTVQWSCIGRAYRLHNVSIHGAYLLVRYASYCHRILIDHQHALKKHRQPNQPGTVLRECEAWTVVDKNSRNARVFGARYWREG
jgi:hypothetical protein